MIYTKSNKLHKRAVEIIPGGAQVISKYYKGIGPAFIDVGKGSHIWDTDENEYIDWSASLGPVILGYSFGFTALPNVLLPMATTDEVELAEKLIDIIPCAEMVRFFKTGSDATSAAVRLARAITGGQDLVCCGFHGWHDWYASSLPEPKSNGTFDDCAVKVDYGNTERLEVLFDMLKPSCFILEPMNRLCPEKASKEYLQEVRKLCDKHNVILIFDEIIMGFRYAMAGGQEYFGVTPDLACYSKAMANGFPISALVGKKELMQEIEQLQVSGTYFGELLSIQAALDTIKFMEEHNVIKDINYKGLELACGIENIINDLALDNVVSLRGWTKDAGYGPWCQIIWEEKYKDLERSFQTRILEEGIFNFKGEHFTMYAHTQEDIQKTLEVYRDAFKQTMENK